MLLSLTAFNPIADRLDVLNPFLVFFYSHGQMATGVNAGPCLFWVCTLVVAEKQIPLQGPALFISDH